MNIVSVEQGSSAWHQFRAGHFGASEAAAMLGLSKNMTRSELLRMKHTGTSKEFSEWVQANVLDRGHMVEALVRPLVEASIGQDLYPVTLSDGMLSASCDGLTADDSIVWECKQWNERAAEFMRQEGEVPPEHMPQCQQVLMVSGAKGLLFSMSDGTPDRLLIVEVHPDPAWFKRIQAGWAQFAADLAAYVPEVAAPVAVAQAIESLPAVSVRMDGALAVQSNLPAFGVALKAFVAKIPAQPSTDQEFADTEAACKALKKAEEALEAAEAGALASMADVESMRRMVADFRGIARTTRLASEKMVEARKLAIRTEIVTSAQAELDGHILTLNGRLGSSWIGRVAGGFGEAIKGKKTVASVRDACSVALANAKIEASAKADRLDFNRKGLIHGGEDWMFLFADFATVGDTTAETFAAIAESRIARHEAAQAEAQRKREAEAAALVVPALVAPVAPVAAPEVRPSVVSAPAALPPRNLLLVDLESSDVLHALILHIGIARHGKFPTAPKVGAEWWSRLYKLSDELAVEVAA